VVVNLIINYRDKSGKRKKMVVPISDDVYEMIKEIKRETGLSEQTILEFGFMELYKAVKTEKKLKDYWERVICG
jgi:lysyl-tRNA synthetase class II